MARKETMDRPLFARLQTQFQTADLDTLLHSPSDDLLTFIRKAPLIYGFWGDFKRLVKAAEKTTSSEAISALLTRLDTVDLPRHSPYLPDSSLEGQSNSVGRMAYDGQYAYLAVGDWRSAGVHIVDMSLPAVPTVVSKIKIQGVTDIAVSGTKLLVLQGTSWNVPGRLAFYDVTHPSNPKPEGGVDLQNGVRMAIVGSVIAVITGQSGRSGLQLIDASLPGQLRLMGHVAIPQPVALQVVGATAYIVTEGRQSGKLVMVDISNPLQPRKIQEISIPASQDIVVQGRHAYLACSTGRYRSGNTTMGLGVIDLDPPAFGGAKRVALLALGNPQHLAVQGRYAYVSLTRSNYNDKNMGGLRIVDLADPARPQLVGSLPADDAGHVTVAGDVVCIGIDHHWNNRFRALNVADPTHPLLLGTPPGRETLGYMKRRGRRLLHSLALRNPEIYVPTAVQMLLEAGQAQATIDPRTQWISLDLLYGGGTRYEQSAHGRGSYGTPRPGLSLRTREERFPELWDRNPELALPLFTTPKLPWQTWETACKILLGTQTALPALNDRMLAQFLATPSPLLRAVAGRQIAATLAAGRSVAADVAADAYLGGTHRRRVAIEQYLGQQQGDAKWSTAFATRLFQIASDGVTGPQLTRKAALAFALLISRFPTLFSRDLKSQTVIALYNTGRADFVTWALEAFRHLLPGQLPEWLTILEALPAQPREAAVQAILAGMASKDVLPRAVEELVRHENAWVRQIGWRVLAHSQTSLAPISSAWSSLLNSNEATPALLTALESPDALALFRRCNFDSNQMAALLKAHPFLIPLFPMSALEKVVAVLPPEAVLQLVAEATEHQWTELQVAILLGPMLPQNRSAFWQEAFASIGATGSANLIARLLNDPKLQAAFLQLPDISAYLKSANPVFGPLLGQWIAAHTDLLRRDSPELLQIATHPLPEIRNVGMNRVRELGMSLPFALRLLESELPPSVALGKTFFEEIDAGDSQRTEAITALCDSPKPSVRAYGREFLTTRPEMLTDNDVRNSRSENPDPATQAFVAEKLLTQAATSDQTVAFDRTVMRARDKGRRAKELVKTRLDAQPTPDIALLLEMARSRTPRDADWALSQLAKLALDGVEIPGFTLDGVAGG